MQIFLATAVSLPHYDEGPIDYLLKSQSQAYFCHPQPGENKDVWIRFTVEWYKKARIGRNEEKTLHVAPMCNQCWSAFNLK